jgi:outer membrane protein TolC
VQFTNYDFSHIKPGALPASVLNNRPDLLIAQIKLKASYAQVGLAQSNLFPAIKLDTFVGASAGDNQLAAPTNYTTLSDAYLNWGINPAVIGQIEAQQGAYQAETYAYIKTVRKILAEVDNDYSANSKARSSYISLYQAYQDYAHKYQLQQGLYHNGLLARPELLKSKLVLDNFALSANLAKLQEGMSLVNLYQSLAGGYKFESAPHANSASAAKRNS